MKQITINLETTSDICRDELTVGLIFHLSHCAYFSQEVMRNHLNYPDGNRDRKILCLQFLNIHRYANFSFNFQDCNKFEELALSDVSPF